MDLITPMLATPAAARAAGARSPSAMCMEDL